MQHQQQQTASNQQQQVSVVTAGAGSVTAGVANNANNVAGASHQQQVVVSSGTAAAVVAAAAQGKTVTNTGSPVVLTPHQVAASVIGSSSNNMAGGNNVTVCSSIPISICNNNSGVITTAAAIVSTTPGLLSLRAATAGSNTNNRSSLPLSASSQATVVSVNNIALQNAKVQQKTGTSGALPVTPSTVPISARTLTNQQLLYLRQHAQQRQQPFTLQQGKAVATSSADQTIKRVQIAAAQPGATVPAITAIQVSQAGRTHLLKSGTIEVSQAGRPQLLKSGTIEVSQAGRTQLLKPSTIVGASTSTGASGLVTTGKTVARTVTESEMNALLRRQQQPLTKGSPVAQMLANKRNLVGVKGPTVGLQLGGKAVGGGGVSTVQIVQGGAVHQKQMTIQQVFKQVPPQALPHLQSGTVVVKSQANVGLSASSSSAGVVSQATTLGTSQATTKLLPVTVAQGQQQPIKQTIQVVSAGSSAVGSSGPSAIRVSSGDRPSSTLAAIQANAVKVTNPTLISQVNAALQANNQSLPVSVRAPTMSPVRIHTSTLSSQQHLLQQQQNNNSNNQQ